MRNLLGKRSAYKWLLLFFGIAVAFCCVFLIWKKIPRQRIQDTIYADIDRDGDDEKIVLLWKKGRFGKHRPFWIKEDEDTYSQHIFIYDVLEDGSEQQKWFASDIGREVVRMKIIGKNADTLLLEDTEGNNPLWRWGSWGLKNVENEVEFIAFGDNIIHKEIMNYAGAVKKGSYDFLYEPYSKEISEADIAAFGAETVLVDKESAVSGYPNFGSPLEVGEALEKAGFDIAVCGNNHALDKGISGIDVTTSFYNNNGIITVGVQNSRDKEYVPYETIAKNGLKFALFSYTYGTNGKDASSQYPYAVHYLPVSEKEKERAAEDIKRARSEADFVIVFAHWGNEYEKEVSKEQRKAAEFFASAGADVIIGSHPHVVQKTDIIECSDGRKTIVFYSLGNFRAYQGRSEETKTGGEAVIVFEHSYEGTVIKSYELREIDAFAEGIPD